MGTVVTFAFNKISDRLVPEINYLFQSIHRILSRILNVMGSLLSASIVPHPAIISSCDLDTSEVSVRIPLVHKNKYHQMIYFMS